LATIVKRSSNRWQARVRRDGQVLSRTFHLKADAQAWARKIETAIETATYLPTEAAERTPLTDAIERYRREVAPRLAGGGKKINSCLDRLADHLGKITLLKLDSAHVASYRDARLRDGFSPQTVRHDLGLLNRILKCCQIDWGIHLPRGLPTALVRLPPMPRARDRRLDAEEETALLEAAQKYGGDIHDMIGLAIETAMRRSELLGLRWEKIDLGRAIARLDHTKNGDPRDVPLSPRALDILRSRARDIGPVFGFAFAESVTKAFSRVCTAAGITNLHFHDLRHEATSRLFELGLNMMEVAAITGHKTLTMLKRYTHLRAEDLAVRLAERAPRSQSTSRSGGKPRGPRKPARN